ncbi:MAG: S1 RNA-binding domain-containing protein [Clostridia bacterium]|nr:S1 RNA-binding domain-containing protein [Clostridia bacterium]
MQLEVGKILEGKITGITNFGAFVQLEGGKTGLVHISEVALTFVKDIKEHLKEGDSVKVKVLSIDENDKVSLSIKKALEEEQKKQAKVPAQVSFGSDSSDMSFEEKMKQFMQDSEEKMSAIKRNMDNKRSGGYKR